MDSALSKVDQFIEEIRELGKELGISEDEIDSMILGYVDFRLSVGE